VGFVVAHFVHEFIEQGDKALVFCCRVWDEDGLRDFGPVGVYWSFFPSSNVVFPMREHGTYIDLLAVEVKRGDEARFVLRMERLQHRLVPRCGGGAGGAFGAAVALLPVLQGARADADQRGELALAQAEFLADGASVGPVERLFAGGFLFAAQDGTAFLEAGDELLEEFVQF
jgi:hypothetical protein